MKILRIAQIATLLFSCMIGTSYAAQLGPNGHWYDVIQGQLSWAGANSAAASLTNSVGSEWYLATITSKTEQDFIAALLGPAGDDTKGYTLGGFQPAGSTEPGGGWKWVTPEPFIYTNWGSKPGLGTEPNDSGGEDYLYIDNRYNWGWNDYLAEAPPGFYIVGAVVEHNAVPEPSTLLLLGGGLLGLVGLNRRRKA